MTPTDLAAALDEIGLTRGRLATLCGVARETVYRWLREPDAKDSLPVPIYTQTIIRLLRGDTVDTVLALYRMERATPDWEKIGQKVTDRYPNTLAKLR